VPLNLGLAIRSDQDNGLKCIVHLAVIAVCTLGASGCANPQGLSSSNPSVTQGLALASSLPGATVGKPYSGQLPVSGGSPPYHFTLSQGALPVGLSLDPETGNITGIPAKAGTFDFTISVVASVGQASASHAYAVPVAPCDACSKLAITPLSPSVAPAGKIQFAATVTNTSNPAVTWSASAGNISATGLFTAPASMSIKTIIVTAVSVADATIQASTTVTATGASEPLQISTSSLAPANTGEPYSASLVATGGSGPYHWNIASGSLPGGLQVSSSSGAISGAPLRTGTFTFGISVTDASGQTALQNFSLLVSSSAACGPPAYCSRTDLAIAQLPSTPPNIGNLTGANLAVTDPDFRNRVVRVTDWNTDPSSAGTTRTYVASGSGSADENIWNVNSTLFIVQNTGGAAYPFSFDPKTMQAARLYASSYPATGGLRLSDAGTWSRVDPNVLYSYTGTSMVKYDFTVRTTPPTAQSIFDFTSGAHCLPHGFVVTWQSRGGVSMGDAVFGLAYSNSGGQGTGIYALAYRPGSGCSLLNTQTGRVTGDWGVSGTLTIPDRWTIHNAKLSKDGNWLIIAPQTCTSTTCSKGPYFWQIGTTTVNSCGDGGHCSGHWTEGYNHWVNDNNSPIGNQVMRLMSQPAGVATLIGLLPPGLAAPLDQHQSWNNADPADSVPFLSASYSPTTPFPAPWYNEIIAVASNGSGKVWRFAHSFISAQSQTFCTKYAIGSVSQDGRFFLFSSDWMGTLGSESGTKGCTIGKDCRGDAFVVELK
jgi:hypothetical protein